MKVIEFIEMLNKLTDEQKLLQLRIDYVFINSFGSCDTCDLEYFSIDRILDDAGYVIINGS